MSEPAVAPPARRHRTALLLAAAYVAGLAALVLSPISDQLNRLTVRLYVIWLYDLRLPGHPTPETFGVALNVLLFVPAGLLLVLITRWSWLRCTLACAAVSAGIEAVQGLVLTDRYASLGDLTANASGALVGALLGAWWLRRRIPARPSADR